VPVRGPLGKRRTASGVIDMTRYAQSRATTTPRQPERLHLAAAHIHLQSLTHRACSEPTCANLTVAQKSRHRQGSVFAVGGTVARAVRSTPVDPVRTEFDAPSILGRILVDAFVSGGSLALAGKGVGKGASGYVRNPGQRRITVEIGGLHSAFGPSLAFAERGGSSDQLRHSVRSRFASWSCRLPSSMTSPDNLISENSSSEPGKIAIHARVIGCWEAGGG
jgi:hypothetical protein